MTEFAAPATASGVDYKELKGSLLMFNVGGVERDFQTAFGKSNPVRANMTVLDGVKAGEVYDDALIFPKVLCSQLSPNVGKLVLGRLVQGNAKPAQSPPWMLQEATDADRQVATDFLAGRVAQPAASAQPPF